MKICGVLGGGISGLAACYYLNKLGKGLIDKIILFESNAKCGGWVDSMVDANGVLFEKGPRSIRSQGISALNTIELIDELGLRHEVLPISKNHLSAKNRFIYVKGHLHKLPNNLKAIITTNPPFTKPLLYSIMKEVITPKLSEKQEWSVDEFFRKRFGSEVADYMADPLCRGIYAGSSKRLSMASSFFPIHDLEARFGSVLRGMALNKKEKKEVGELAENFRKEGWVVWSLREGMQQLSHSILQNLAKNEKIQVETNTKCHDLLFKDHTVEVTTDSKKSYHFNHVFSALPSFELAKITNKNHPKLSELLEKIEFVDVGVVNLVYRGDVMPPYMGFGHLVPSHEDPAVLGVIYEGCSFPQHNGTFFKNRFTVMIGGHWFKEVFDGEGGANVMNKLEEMSIKTIHQHLGIKESPEKVIVNLLKKCIPQYNIGHKNLLSQISSYLSSKDLAISLVGSSYRGVSVNDCIYNSRLAVQKFLQHS